MIDKEPLKNDHECPIHGNGAVLLSNQIKRFAEKYRMIDPFCEKNLKAASYYLTLGEECQQRGKSVTLSDSNRYLYIKPYELAVLSTYEAINLPRFIIGRWNLRVHMAYEGLLWVGGPQVDPGYQGKLHCPIYNLSNREVRLIYHNPIFTIDFVYTTPFDESMCRPFALNRIEALEALDIHRLQSGLVETAESAKETLEQTKGISSRVDNYIMIVFIVLSVVIMSIAIVATAPLWPETAIPWNWQKITFGLSVSALAVALITFCLVTRRYIFDLVAKARGKRK